MPVPVGCAAVEIGRVRSIVPGRGPGELRGSRDYMSWVAAMAMDESAPIPGGSKSRCCLARQAPMAVLNCN